MPGPPSALFRSLPPPPAPRPASVLRGGWDGGRGGVALAPSLPGCARFFGLICRGVWLGVLTSQARVWVWRSPPPPGAQRFRAGQVRDSCSWAHLAPRNAPLLGIFPEPQPQLPGFHLSLYVTWTRGAGVGASPRGAPHLEPQEGSSGASSCAPSHAHRCPPTPLHTFTRVRPRMHTGAHSHTCVRPTHTAAHMCSHSPADTGTPAYGDTPHSLLPPPALTHQPHAPHLREHTALTMSHPRHPPGHTLAVTHSACRVTGRSSGRGRARAVVARPATLRLGRVP